MRILIGFAAMILFAVFIYYVTKGTNGGASGDAQLVSLAIVFAGAMAGGD